MTVRLETPWFEDPTTVRVFVLLAEKIGQKIDAEDSDQRRRVVNGRQGIKRIPVIDIRPGQREIE